MLRKFVYVRQRNGVEDEKSTKRHNQNTDADTRNTTKKAIKRPGDVPTQDGRHKTQSRDFKYKTLFKERRRKTPTGEDDEIKTRHASYYDDWQRGHVPLNYEHFLFDKTSCESKRCNPRKRETFVLDDPELTKVEIISNGSVRTLFVQKKENAVRMDNNVSRGKNTCLCEKEDYGEGFLCKGMTPRLKVCDATIRKTSSVCSPISHSFHTPCQNTNTYSKSKWPYERNGGERKSKVQFSSKNNCTTFTDQNDYQLNTKQDRKQHQIHKMNNTDTDKKSKEQFTYTKNKEEPTRHICDINGYEKEEEHLFINLPGAHRETKGENMPFESMLDNIHEFNEATQHSRQIFPRETKTSPKKPRGVPQNKEKEYLNYELDSKTNDFTDKEVVFDGNDDHEMFISYLENETSDSEDTNNLIFLSHSPTVLSFYPRKKNNSNFELDRKEFHKTDSNEKDSDILSCSEKKFNFGQICPNISKFTLDILNSTPELQNEIYFNAQDPLTQKSTTDARVEIKDKFETFPKSSDSDFEITISTDGSVAQPYEKTKIRKNGPNLDEKSNVTIEENHRRFLNDPYLEYKNSDDWKKKLLDKYDFKNNLRLNIDESKTSPRKPLHRIENYDLVVTKDNLFLSNDSSESAGNHLEYKSDRIRNIDNSRSKISPPKVFEDPLTMNLNLKLRIGEPKTAVLPAKNSYDKSLISDEVSSEELKHKPNIHTERHLEKPVERIHYPNSNSNSNRNYIIESLSNYDDFYDDDSGDNADGDNIHEFEDISQKIETETKSNLILKIGESSIADNSKYKPFMYSHISDSELKNFKNNLKKIPNSISGSNNIVYCPENNERLTDNRSFHKTRDNDYESRNISQKINNDTTTKSIPVLRIGEPSNSKYIPLLEDSLSKIKVKTEKDVQTELGLKKSSLKASKVNSDLNDRFKYNIYQEILDDKDDYGDNNHSDSSGDNDSDYSTEEYTYNVDNKHKVKDNLFKMDQRSRHSILNDNCVNKNNYRSRFLEKGMLRIKDCIADTGIKIVETTPLNPVAELRPLFEMKGEPTTTTPIQPHKKKKERLKRCASVGVTTPNVKCPTVLPHKSKQAMFQYELAEDGWLAEKKGIVGLKDLHKGELNIDDDVNHVIKMYSSACIALGNIKLMF